MYETYFDKQFFDDSVMYGQLYLQDKLELDEYTKILQEDLVKAKENYVKKKDGATKITGEKIRAVQWDR